MPGLLGDSLELPEILWTALWVIRKRRFSFNRASKKSEQAKKKPTLCDVRKYVNENLMLKHLDMLVSCLQKTNCILIFRISTKLTFVYISQLLKCNVFPSPDTIAQFKFKRGNRIFLDRFKIISDIIYLSNSIWKRCKLVQLVRVRFFVIASAYKSKEFMPYVFYWVFTCDANVRHIFEDIWKLCYFLS